MLNEFARNIRATTLKMLKHRTFGHLGGSMSIVETLAVLYGKQMNIDPKRPKKTSRDYFVLSKGHAGPALYATLAIKGYFDRALLKTLNDNGTTLPSHCDMHLTPGIDMTTGSLGQGFSAAVGMALGLKLKGKSNRVYVLVGDGELNEGQCYEAMMFAAHKGLDNLIVLIDDNKLQLDGPRTKISNTLSFMDVFKAFNFHVSHVDGHDTKAIDDAITHAKTLKHKPTAIVLDTVKGQGVPKFENQTSNHHMRFSEDDQRYLEHIIQTLKKVPV